MEFLQLEYFLDAAKTENFSQTAKKYNVPPSNISQTVKRLEEELGVKLFDRSSNRVTLSEKGKIFYEGALRGIREIEQTQSCLSSDNGEVRGEINLLIETNRRLVTAAIERFRRGYPHVSIIISHTADQSAKYDIIVSDTLSYEGEYDSRFLIKEPMRLACLRGSYKKRVSLSDLRGERFVSMGKTSRLYSFVNEMCRKCGFTPDIAIQTDDPFYVRKYVEIGLGVAIVPAISWGGLFSDNVALVDVGDFFRTTYLYMPVGKGRNTAAKKLAEIIYSVFDKESATDT